MQNYSGSLYKNVFIDNSILLIDVRIRLLRPEFVRAYPKPLCSDAFSPATRAEKEHNEEVTIINKHFIPRL